MAEWRRILEVDLLSVVRGCRLFLPGMLAQGRGQVISTASFAGLAGAPGLMTYGTAKAAVVALSEQLRAEVEPRGVRVSVICPSFFRTNLCESGIGNPATMKLALHLMDTAPGHGRFGRRPRVRASRGRALPDHPHPRRADALAPQALVSRRFITGC